MLNGRGRILPHEWVAGDDEIGRIPWFRKALREINEPYVLAVPSNILIWDLEENVTANTPVFVSVGQWMKSVPAQRWKTVSIPRQSRGL